MLQLDVACEEHAANGEPTKRMRWLARFEPGRRGNPAGRPRGIRDKRSMLRAQIEDAADGVVSAVVASALQGDIGACKLLLDKVIANARSQEMPVALELGSSRTVAALSVEILAGLQFGTISPEQADRLTSSLLNLAQLREAETLEMRLRVLERRSMSDGERD
jgi:hypothetical protein